MEDEGPRLVSLEPRQRNIAGKPAPVQGSRDGFEVPWDVHVRAWQVYAACGHRSQSAVRIAERGGFGASEMVMLLSERQVYTNDAWQPINDVQRARLDAIRAIGAES